MKHSQTLGVLLCAFLIFCCFQKWLFIENPEKYLSGFKATVDNNTFGSPGKLHLFFGIVSGFFFTLPKIWAKRTNLIFTALNVAWAIRNFFYLGLTCRGGICPTLTWFIYAIFISSILIFVMSLLPRLDIEKKK